MRTHEPSLWLPTALGRFCFFLFSVTVIVFSLFLLGNFENFLDSTQILLLKASAVLSELLAVSCLYYAVLMGWLAFRGKWTLEPGKVVAAALAVLLFGALSVGARYLLVWV